MRISDQKDEHEVADSWKCGGIEPFFAVLNIRGVGTVLVVDHCAIDRCGGAAFFRDSGLRNPGSGFRLDLTSYRAKRCGLVQSGQRLYRAAVRRLLSI